MIICAFFIVISASYANTDIDTEKNNLFCENNYDINEISEVNIENNVNKNDNFENESINSESKNQDQANSTVAKNDILSNDQKSNTTNTISTSNSPTTAIKAAGDNAPPSSLTQKSIINAAKTVNKYISKNKKLPNSVTISGYKFSMPEFMYLLSKTITYKYKNSAAKVKVKYNIKNPSSPSGQTIKGKISKKNYNNYAKKIIKFIDQNNQAPNFVNATEGRIQYQTAIYMMVKVLNYHQSKNKLPSSVSINIKSSHKINKNLPKYTRPVTPKSSLTLNEILKASETVKNYIEKNDAIPSTITISGAKYKIHDFLYAMATAIVYKTSGKTSKVKLLSTKTASNPSGNNKLGQIQKAEYIKLAKTIVSHYKSNKKAPDYVATNLGNLKYHSIVYVFARINSYMHNSKSVPNYVEVTVNSAHKLNGGTKKISSSSSKSLNEAFDGGSLEQYLKATKNCQVNNAAIAELAQKITKNCNTDKEKATAIYKWVQDNIDYSFYYDTKYGAVKTKDVGQGNCVDMAHLSIALYRSAGLAARYVHGTCTFSSGSTYGHVWAQVLIDNTWTVSDTTSSRNALGTINNWNTGSYSLKGKYNEIGF